MLLAHSREFVLRMSERVFLPYVDAEDCSSYVHPGELDFECLGRFRSGHPECPGDVLEEDVLPESKESITPSSNDGEQREGSAMRRRVPDAKGPSPPEGPQARSPIDNVCLVFSFVSLGVFLIFLEAGVIYFLWRLFSLVARGFAEVKSLWSTAVDCYPLCGLAQWRACIVATLEGRAAMEVSDALAPP